MHRKSRLSSILAVDSSHALMVKDHITGEILMMAEIAERLRLGFYSAYQVRHLKLQIA